jgi:Copper transport outer membrane protein, MctB
MFDLRYHVASLTAVFVALLIGIVVGVGVSGSVDKGEKSLAKARENALRGQLDAARSKIGDLTERQVGAIAYLNETYPSVMHNRLKNKKIAAVYVGSDTSMGSVLERTLRDAGSRGFTRVRALSVPVDPEALDKVLAGRPQLAALRGNDQLESLGRAVAQEIVNGGETPILDALSGELVAYRSGGSATPADAVVVARSVEPQVGGTARFLHGLYTGLSGIGVPAVGVETLGTTPSAVTAYKEGNLSTVDDVDQPIGRFALALLLQGAQAGHYGLKDTASGPIPPLPRPVG